MFIIYGCIHTMCNNIYLLLQMLYVNTLIMTLYSIL